MVESGLRWFDAWGGIILKGYKEASLNKVNDTIRTPLKIEGASAPAVDFYDSDTNIQCGAVYFSTADDKRRLAVKQYNADQDTASSKYAECYYLPSPTAGLISDVWYQLISTRDRYLIFPIGSCYTTSTNTNPSTILGGGTWELIDKQFKPWNSNSSSIFTVNSTNCSLTNIYISRASHSIRIRLQILPKVTLGDTTVELGTFNMASLGITNFWNTYYPIGNSDGGGGLTITSLTWDTGVMNHQDTVHRKGSETAITSTSYNIVYDFVVVMPISHMLDSACNQFIWKRTA